MAIEQVGTGPLYGTFPVLAVAVRPTGPAALVYRPSYLFDFQKGDFALDGSGRVIKCDGYTAWGQLLLKIGLTERFAYVIYSHHFGVELDRVVRFETRIQVEAHIAATIAEGFRADMRTAEVFDFAFDWDGINLEADFMVRPTIGADLQINFYVRY